MNSRKALVLVCTILSLLLGAVPSAFAHNVPEVKSHCCSSKPAVEEVTCKMACCTKAVTIEIKLLQADKNCPCEMKSSDSVPTVHLLITVAPQFSYETPVGERVLVVAQPGTSLSKQLRFVEPTRGPPPRFIPESDASRAPPVIWS